MSRSSLEEVVLPTYVRQSSGSLGGDTSIASSAGKHKSLSATLAKKEQKAVRVLRLFGLVLLVGVALSVSVGAYFYTRGNEVKAFERQYLDYADKVVDAFLTNGAQRVGLIESLSVDITTYAISSKAEWPFVTLPEFPRRVSQTANFAEMLYILFAPFVPAHLKTEWEEYAVENGSWLKEALALNENGTNTTTENITIPDKIRQINPEGPPTLDNGPGPYQVIWQFAPAVPAQFVISINLNSIPLNYQTYNETIDNHQSIVGRSNVLEERSGNRNKAIELFLNRWKTDGNEFEDGPVADLYVPVFDSFDKKRKKAVGIVKATIYWQMYFTGVLPNSANGIICVLENSCGQTYSYKINGDQVRYMGAEDLHQPEYDHLEVRTEYGDFLKGSVNPYNTSGVHCDYRIRVYPCKQMEKDYLTSTPVIFTCVLLFVFLFTSFVFILYDLIVERRQRIVMDTAVKSTTVVTSLFPEAVRDRLYDEATGGGNITQGGDSSTTETRHDGNGSGDSETVQITSFLHGSLAASQNNGNKSEVCSMPIAESYEHCTVFFADMAGFTRWSSGRNPPEVFLLLETVYGAFDKIAHSRHVFKVETIGDCYLAVTGLPDPQSDHAVKMARFAFDCLAKMNHVMNELADSLGDGTKDLSLRVGMHSGRVTAGVLRGAKARFQLFGDTVNQASRMESTGEAGKVQASQETAELLIASGKKHWVHPREDKVVAKGIGELQTYWLNPDQMDT